MSLADMYHALHGLSRDEPAPAAAALNVEELVKAETVRHASMRRASSVPDAVANLGFAGSTSVPTQVTPPAAAHAAINPAVTDRSAALERLTAARLRLIERLKLSPVSPPSDKFDLHSIHLELRSDDNDSPRLSLAKAGARLCIRQFGVDSSAQAIAHVRRLAGGDVAVLRDGQHNGMVSGRVLGAMPRR